MKCSTYGLDSESTDLKLPMQTIRVRACARARTHSTVHGRIDCDKTEKHTKSTTSTNRWSRLLLLLLFLGWCFCCCCLLPLVRSLAHFTPPFHFFVSFFIVIVLVLFSALCDVHAVFFLFSLHSMRKDQHHHTRSASHREKKNARTYLILTHIDHTRTHTHPSQHAHFFFIQSVLWWNANGKVKCTHGIPIDNIPFRLGILASLNDVKNVTRYIGVRVWATPSICVWERERIKYAHVKNRINTQ